MATVTKILASSLVVLAAGLFIGLWAVRRTRQELSTFSEFLLSAKTSPEPLPPGRLQSREFRQLAATANEMIAERSWFIDRLAASEERMDLGTLLTGTTPGMTDLGLFLARVFIGVCFIVHGLGKLGLVGGGTMQGFQEWLESLGVPMPAVNARMAMLTEITGGLLLTAGLFTRPACVALIATMGVAGLVGHKGAGYLITNEPPGAEYTINLAAICFVFLLLGPGAISADALLF